MLGTGIANVWSRPGETAEQEGATLAQAHPGRFVLGVGIGHAFQATKQSARSTGRSTGCAPICPKWTPRGREPRWCSRACSPRSGRRCWSCPATTPTARTRSPSRSAHTPYAREILGPDKLLIPQQTVLLGGREDAREFVRHHVAMLLEHDVKAYHAGWKRLGYTDADINEPTDRFVDDLVIWGDAETIAKRLDEVLDAGADHVLLTPAAPTFESTVDTLAELAPAVLR